MSTSPAEKKNATQLLGIMANKASRNRLLPSDFLEMVIARTGGPEEFAAIVANILNDGKVAGVAKQRIISDMTRMMQHVETKSKPPADLSSYSTQDLEALMRQIIAEMETASVGPAADTGRDGGPAPTGSWQAEVAGPPEV